MTVTITFSNIQSVRNKENELLEYLTNNNFDCATETQGIENKGKHYLQMPQTYHLQRNPL